MAKIRTISRRLLPWFLLALAVAVFAALVKTRPEARTQAPPDDRVRVASQVVEVGPVQPQKRVHGRITVPQRLSLAAALSADVRQVAVREGERIRTGQLLLALDERETRLLLAQREAEYRQVLAQIDSEHNRQQSDQQLLRQEQQLLELAREAVRRAETLETRSLASQSSLDEARRNLLQQTIALAQRQRAIADHPARLAALEAQRDQAESRLQQARLQLEHTRLLSPFDGRVAAVHAAPGQHVRPGNALVEIFDDGRLEIRAALPADLVTEANGVRPGASARARIGGRDYRLRLDRLGARVQQGAVAAFFRFEDDPRGLPLDQVVEVILDLPPVEAAFVLPGEALYGTDRVYKIVDQRLRAVRVRLLGSRLEPGQAGQLVLASDAIRSGDRVLTSKFATAADGLAVAVR